MYWAPTYVKTREVFERSSKSATLKTLERKGLEPTHVSCSTASPL